MEVVATPDLVDHVRSHGGALYVDVRPSRGCAGVRLLDATTSPPPDRSGYLMLLVEDVAVLLRPATRLPRQLVLELRGWRRRPAAFWDGCAFVV